MIKKIIFTVATIVILVMSIYFARNTTQEQVAENAMATSTIITNATSSNEAEVVVGEEEYIESLVSVLPESFKGVEMTTHKSEYGFEITYPKSWTRDERDFSKGGTDEIVRYILNPAGDTDPIIIISIYNTDNKEVVKEFPHDIFIEVNGNKGINTVFDNGLISYSFIEDSKLYEVKVYHRTLNKLTYAGLHEDEMRWIVSTFKIVN